MDVLARAHHGVSCERIRILATDKRTYSGLMTAIKYHRPQTIAISMGPQKLFEPSTSQLPMMNDNFPLLVDQQVRVPQCAYTVASTLADTETDADLMPLGSV